jgi:hypothetical protein
MCGARTRRFCGGCGGFLYAMGLASFVYIHSFDLGFLLLLIVAEIAGVILGSGLEGEFGGQMVAFLAWLGEFVEKFE